MTDSVMNWLPYAAYVAPAAWILLRLGRSKTRRQHAAMNAFRESREAGLDSPASLHPVIDHAKCIGCEACVHACPEYPNHNVLGVMRGKAHLVSPSDCIGHGACKTACPVGAIRLVFGTAERGVDIPEVKPNFETNVPGIFIAGELGGMGLIRNAIEQGRQAVDGVKSYLGNTRPVPKVVDLLIVGAGPAGLSAALAAKASKLDYLVVEQDSLGGTVAHFPRRKLVMTAPAKLALAGEMQFKETTKEVLMDYWQNVAKRYQIKVASPERATGIKPHSDGTLEVSTTKGVRRARAVLLALGRRGTPRKLGVPGEELPKVAYRLADPAEYAGKRMLVVGGGDSALEAALALAETPGTQVTVSYRSESFSRAKPKNRARIEDMETKGNSRVLLESNVVAIGKEKVRMAQGGKEFDLANDYVIVCAGGELPTPFLKQVGINVETKYGTE